MQTPGREVARRTIEPADARSPACVAAPDRRRQRVFVARALSGMDAEAAVEEAHRRWGKRGAISFADKFRHSRHLVGELIPGPRFIVRGRGSSWEAAFADADARGTGASRRRSPTAVPHVGGGLTR